MKFERRRAQKKKLTILRKVIPKLSSGSKPYSENSEPSCFLAAADEAAEPGVRGSEVLGFSVSRWKSEENPLNGFLAGWNSISLGKRARDLAEGSCSGFSVSVWITEVSAIGWGILEASISEQRGENAFGGGGGKWERRTEQKQKGFGFGFCERGVPAKRWLLLNPTPLTLCVSLSCSVSFSLYNYVW